jgi:CubicO group peptidase (beta-lactamase class C family)
LALREAPFVAERGTEVRYSNPGYTVYSIVLAKAASTAGQGSDIEDLLQDRVLGPLGIPERATVLSYGKTFDGEGTPYREVGGGGRFTARGRPCQGDGGGGRRLERAADHRSALPRRGAATEPGCRACR